MSKAGVAERSGRGVRPDAITKALSTPPDPALHAQAVRARVAEATVRASGFLQPKAQSLYPRGHNPSWKSHMSYRDHVA